MERKKMKKKGFTLVELLVVIAIIAMLLAILMPALGKVRQLAQRIMCGTNLAGIGKAMLTYSTDDKYESFPISGSSGAYWNKGTGSGATHLEGSCSWDWRKPDAFPETATAKYATLSSCLYLLVKYADVSPDQYICPGSDQKKFEFSKYDMTTTYQSSSTTDVWDFGSNLTAQGYKAGLRGKGHNSYSYQLPFPLTSNQSGGVYPITTTSNPARAVMADRNPYWQDTMGAASNSYLYAYTCSSSTFTIRPETVPFGNNTYHQKDGQNVLFADQHSKFEKQANCSVELDNIYTTWGTSTINSGNCTDTTAGEPVRQCGEGATSSVTAGHGALQGGGVEVADYYPLNENDSYLVSDVDNPD